MGKANLGCCSHTIGRRYRAEKSGRRRWLDQGLHDAVSSVRSKPILTAVPVMTREA